MVRRRFRELKRRHNEYRHVIGLGDYVTPLPSDTNVAGFTTADLIGRLFENFLAIISVY